MTPAVVESAEIPRIDSATATGQPARQRAPTAASRAARRRKVSRLFSQGLCGAEIANRLSVDRSTVCRDLQALSKRWRTEAVADVGAVRAVELGRVEAVLHQAHAAFQASGDARQGELALRAASLRAKLLGLDHADGAAFEADRQRLMAGLVETARRFFHDGPTLAAFALCLRYSLAGLPVEQCPEYGSKIAPVLARIESEARLDQDREALNHRISLGVTLPETPAPLEGEAVTAPPCLTLAQPGAVEVTKTGHGRTP